VDVDFQIHVQSSQENTSIFDHNSWKKADWNHLKWWWTDFVLISIDWCAACRHDSFLCWSSRASTRQLLCHITGNYRLNTSKINYVRKVLRALFRHHMVWVPCGSIIFRHYLVYIMIFGKKNSPEINCVLTFSATFSWNISHSEKKSVRCYHKCENIVM
jgi:hypothetical protein